MATSAEYFINNRMLRASYRQNFAAPRFLSVQYLLNTQQAASKARSLEKDRLEQLSREHREVLEERGKALSHERRAQQELKRAQDHVGSFKVTPSFIAVPISFPDEEVVTSTPPRFHGTKAWKVDDDIFVIVSDGKANDVQIAVITIDILNPESPTVKYLGPNPDVTKLVYARLVKEIVEAAQRFVGVVQSSEP